MTGLVRALVLPGTELYGQVVEFLHREAQLLDSYRFAGWLDRLDVRSTRRVA